MKVFLINCRTRTLGLFYALLLSASPTSAGQNDYIKEVFVCSSDVFIRMQTAGWLIASSALNQKQQDRILSIALTLLSTGKPTSYFDEGAAVAACGIASAKHVSALGIIGG